MLSMESYKYDVFISYSRRDTNVVDKICKAFDDNNISYFIDRQGIGGGLEFPKVLAEAILSSQIFLFIASENSYKSKFTQSEVVFAFNKKQKSNIIPYIIDDSTLPSELELTFSAINWRRKSKHPIETTLVDDVLKRVGKTRIVEETGNHDLKRLFYKQKGVIFSVCALIGLICIFFVVKQCLNTKEPVIIEPPVQNNPRYVTDSLITNPTLGQRPYFYSGPIDSVGLPHGKGTARFQDDNGTCEGYFYHGVLDGDDIVKQTLKNGDMYIGIIKDNEYETGDYIWKDGEKYSGTFQNGMPYTGTHYNSGGGIVGVYDKGKSIWGIQKSHRLVVNHCYFVLLFRF